MSVWLEAVQPSGDAGTDFQLANDAWAPILALMESSSIPSRVVDAFRFSTGASVSAADAETVAAALRQSLARNSGSLLSLAHESLFGVDPCEPFEPGMDLVNWMKRAKENKSVYTVDREAVDDLIRFLCTSGGVTVG